MTGTVLLITYGLVITGVILFYLIIEKYKRAAVRHQETAIHFEDLLNAAPDGFYYETRTGDKTMCFCSRRLCLMLDITDTSASFETVLSRLNESSRAALTRAIGRLEPGGFEQPVSNHIGTLHFTAIGRVLETPFTDQKAFVIWFKNTSDETDLLLREREAYRHLLQQREVLTRTINTLPFPLYVQDKSGTVCFANTAHQKETDESDMHWVELPLPLERNTEPFTLKYGQDKTTEEGLNALLVDAERAHKVVLKELGSAAALFDSATRLTFANKAFSDLWGLENYWLKKEPFYEDFLNKIQENGFLPQVKDFAQYKRIQKNAFAQLMKPTEEFLYLPAGKVLRQLMIPHAKGGILVIYEEQFG